MTTTLRSSPALRAAHSSRRLELYLVTPAKRANNSSGYLLWCSNFLRVFTAPSINFEISAASPGVKAPSETASRIAALAATASAGRSILGRSKETGRSRRIGAILSRMIFAAVISPLRAAVTTALTISAPSSCISFSASIVILCRVPFAGPAGISGLTFLEHLLSPCYGNSISPVSNPNLAASTGSRPRAPTSKTVVCDRSVELH
jgi:hypothetical protein